MPCDFWTDVVKALIGTFIGASLAFGFAWLLWYLQRRTEQRGALGAAAQQLMQQFNDFGNFARGLGVLKNMQAEVNKEGALVPEWFITQPITMSFNETLHYDWKSIGFVFNSKEGKDLANMLQHCEILHFDLANLVAKHDVVAREVQSKIVSVYPDETKPPTFKEVEKAIGPVLWYGLKTLSAALIERRQKSPAVFQSALKQTSLYAKQHLRMTIKFSEPTGEDDA